MTATTYTAATIPITFTGTAADSSTGLGLAANSTQFSIQRQSDGKYWNGSTWVSLTTYLGTTHSGTTQGTSVDWTSNAILPPWLDDTYTVIARATDRAGNTTDSSLVTFSINTPTTALLTITQPTDTATYTVATIPLSVTGLVKDASTGPGFNSNATSFTLQRQSDGKYWDGSSWLTTPTHLATIHAGTTGGASVAWTSNATLPPWLDDTYFIQARATNKAGTTINSSIVTITVSTPPVVVAPIVSPPPAVFPTPTVVVPLSGFTITGWIVNLPQAAAVSAWLAAAIGLATLLLAALPSIFALPLGLPGAIGPLGNLFAFFLAWLHRRKRYGVVFDSASRDPIEGATVRLLAEGGNEFELGKLLETRKTDKKGRYTFDIRHGQYRIEVIAPEFAFPSGRASIGYRGELIEANDDGLLHPDIPVDSLTPGGFTSMVRFRELGVRLQQLRLPMAIAGTIFATSFFIERGAPVDFAIMTMYVIFWILEYFNQLSGREVAYVTAEGRPAPLTILRLYDNAGRLRATKVTDTQGRYSIFASVGHYLLDVLNRTFDVQSNEIRMREVGIILKHVKLHRLPAADDLNSRP